MFNFIVADLAEEVNAVNKCLYLQQKRISRLTAAKPMVSSWCLQVALIIYVMTSYDWTLAVLWLKSKKRRGDPIREGTTDEDLQQFLENAFLEADETVLTSYLTPQDTTLSQTAIKTAVKFVSEFKLTEGVWKDNISVGKVTSARSMNVKMNALLEGEPAAGSVPRIHPDVKNKSSKNWVARLRKRFYMNWDRIDTVARNMSTDEIKDMVPSAPLGLSHSHSPLPQVDKTNPLSGSGQSPHFPR